MANPNVVFRFKHEVPDAEDRRKQAVMAFNQHPDKVPVSQGYSVQHVSSQSIAQHATVDCGPMSMNRHQPVLEALYH